MNQSSFMTLKCIKSWKPDGVPPVVDFTNILLQDFTSEDTKSTKRLTTWLYFFELLGSALVKAARKMFVKLRPDVSRVESQFGHVVFNSCVVVVAHLQYKLSNLEWNCNYFFLTDFDHILSLFWSHTVKS